MQIKPILAALRRHRLATLLIAMEIAFACAVLCNACFLVARRWTMIQINSGVDESSLAVLTVNGFEPSQAADVNARMLAGLRAIPGMQSATLISEVPFGPQTGAAGISPDAGGFKDLIGVVDFVMAGPGTYKALGLKLVEGHLPQPGDYQPATSFAPEDVQVLVTRALAEHAWPGESPLGKDFWCDKMHFRVMGVVDHFARAQPGQYEMQQGEWTVFTPVVPGGSLAGTYLLRGRPQDVQRVLQVARGAVQKIAPDVVLDQDNSRTLSDLRTKYFLTDRIMIGLLLGVVALMLGVTALGIVGLTSFWVAQRRKQIGIRRAIGATRGDILRYFQTENFLIVTFGIALGMLLAYVLNAVLMKFYELPHLPLYYLPMGALALWMLGQLAVLGPALRAAAVPPVVATRSV
ncbi:FtsX-like permease family protein [Rhodanobacter sp. 7MK24]|uniref:ABC transporter permease n=1 Tax=Rhodanobacter sp. 7MK24 TaxID=2775922 RepID=UPI00177AD71D|nr:FtsX-like permease family protein [Rhodanobacter sp. 7MK24]MBD8880585.1 FtsX-like permease family protein [Rhodanobacter sp. 7MK24]